MMVFCMKDNMNEDEKKKQIGNPLVSMSRSIVMKSRNLELQEKYSFLSVKQNKSSSFFEQKLKMQ